MPKTSSQILKSFIQILITEAINKQTDDSPETDSIEAFAEFLLDDERDSFTFDEVSVLNTKLGIRRSDIVKELEGYGLTYEPRETEKRIRGFKTSSNDRWFGPGSMDSHGGSGADQICGFATTQGRPVFGNRFDPDKSSPDMVGHKVPKRRRKED